MNFLYVLYQGTMVVLSVFLSLGFRIAREVDHRSRFQERKGYSSQQRPEGEIIWFHAAGIGETASLLPLLPKIHALWDKTPILVTTYTTTAARVFEKHAPSYAIHQYLPFDRSSYVQRFLEHWRPSLAVFIESEIWPTLIYQIGQRNIRLALLNGRMSTKSYGLWRRLDSLRLFSLFDLCLTTNEVQASRWRSLGVREVGLMRPLKYASDPLPADPLELERLRDVCRERPVLVIASSHRREESILIRLHQALLKEFPTLLTIIAPRHLERTSSLVRLARNEGIACVQRLPYALPLPSDSLYIANTIGEMGLFYRLATVVLIGGTFYPYGGHNVIEPARLKQAIVTGPYMENFADILEHFLEAEGVIQASNETLALERICYLLRSPQARQTLAENAYAFTLKQKTHCDQSLETLRSLTTLSPFSIPSSNQKEENTA